MSLIRQFAIRNELLYSGFELPNVQIVFVQKISFATFGVSINDFVTRYAGLGYSLELVMIIINQFKNWITYRRVPKAFYRVRILDRIWGYFPLYGTRGEVLWQELSYGIPKG